MPAAVGIDHQQMDRIAAHVKNTQSHEKQTSRATGRGLSRPAETRAKLRIPERAAALVQSALIVV